MSQIRVSRLSRLLCLLIFRAAAGHSAPTLFMIGGASSVSIFDRATLTEQGFVAAPNFTQSVALSSDGTQAYIATGGGIRVVNAITHLLAGRLPSSNAAIVRLSPDGTRLYAANVNGSVWVYDTASGTVTQRIPFLVKDASFYGVADLTVSADGTLVALGSVESMCGEFGCPPGDPPALITEINGQSGTLIKRLPTAYVSSLAISGDDSSVYVAEGSVIVQVNAANGQTTATIPFAANRIALDSVAGRLYAGTANSPYTLGVFSPSDDSSVGSVTLTGPVAALAFSPDHSTIFAGGCVVNEGDDPFPCPVAAISAGTLQASTSGTLTGSPADFAVSAGSNRLWVANGSGVELTAVNTGNNLVSGEAEISYSPFTMAVTPSGNKVYTANLDGTVSVINGYNLSRKKVLNVSATPFNLLGDDCVSPDGKRAYVALDHLQVIDTSSDQIVGTITELPFGCVVSPDSSTVYTYNGSYDETSNMYRLSVTSYAASTLTQLRTQSFLSGQLPSGLFVAPGGGALYLVTPFTAYVYSTLTLGVERTFALNLCISAALSPDGNTSYCLDQPEDTSQPDAVEAIGTTTGTVEQTYSTGVWAFGNVALTPDGSSLYLSLQIPAGRVPGVLAQMNVATGTLALVNTKLFGPLAIR